MTTEERGTKMSWKEDGKLINCTNCFHRIGKERLTEALEAGEKVRIYIECIGHTRAYYTTLEYEKWLREQYGERLVVEKNDFKETTYRLS